ncbi:MAG: 5-formyltetrahydrofolate cyclo-ligase [Burkholderiales bacterium]|nr:5-formyltetrahydrofolate cyclo-ligase [Burkholderiales bacterium]
MQGRELFDWRRSERARLVALREALDPATRAAFRRRIDATLERAFPALARGVVAICWPMRGEYDARHLARRLRARGATIALPVVVAPRAPLEFRAWWPGAPIAPGPLGIAQPCGTPRVLPEAVLLPVVGWDPQGYRLGYGGGYFDRTLAASDPRPSAIGVGYELSRVQTVHPQPWDVPLDWLVTERGLYRRERGALVFLGEPAAAASAG